MAFFFLKMTRLRERKRGRDGEREESDGERQNEEGKTAINILQMRKT